MTCAQLFRFVFILYCTTIGVVLLLAPWTPRWDEIITPELHMLSVPVLRGALSGFGLVHLVWGIHDLSAFLHLPHDEGSQTAGDQ